MKKQLLTVIMGVFIVSITLFQGNAKSEPIELSFVHMVPPQHNQHKGVVEPWARQIEKLTNNRVKINIKPLSPNIIGDYQALISGKIDMTYLPLAYVPGDRFPLSSFMRLPFLVKSAEQGSLLLWHIYKKYLIDEYREFKVLWLFCHPPGQIHLKNKEVNRLEDLKGLRIATSGSKIMNNNIIALGATPVPMGVGDMKAGLESGKIDGAGLPFEVLPAFKINEQLKYHTVINLYTEPFFAGMNKEKYESLPVDIRKIIDENSGEKMSVRAGMEFDKGEAMMIEVCVQQGGKLLVIPEDELERWKEITVPLGDEWIKEMNAKGLQGQELLESAIELLLQIQ